ncbi:MAG TPA: T9SS type A sorting domain-containing protein [Aequorivita sp.]|nr:T9SS type A sorting domain-containing protein [Aequorivita sp.]
MKLINYTIVFLCLAMTNVSFGQEKLCTNFESGTNEGWKEQDAITHIDGPGMDGTKYLEAMATSGSSYIFNGDSYPSDWKQFIGDCLCFDYKVIDDGFPPGILNINPQIILFDTPSPFNHTIKAVFTATITVTENSEWVRICAPIEPSNGQSLPGNANGQWGGVTPAQWNALLGNVGSVAFSVNVGGPRAKAEIIGVDNICIEACESEPPVGDDGAYCCDGENLVRNGNFEHGNMGFSSDYINNSAVYPGEYDVTNSAAAFGATVTDHSFCADPTQYANNNKFLVVNGKTQQGGNSVIWETTISGLNPKEKYKFCANFKNMPQCTFDILPNVNMEAVGSQSTGFSTISTNPNDPCHWINKELDFIATGTSMTIRILLDETGNGDGNDLAIDDISVTKLIDPELNITVQHQGNPSQITASINTIDTSDDKLHGECEYYWYVAEVDSYNPLVINFSTFEYGNDGGNTINASPWDLTTTFPGYVFNSNIMYIIGMYTPACDCYDEGFTYQLTFSNRGGGAGMTEQQKEHIIYLILNGKQDPGVGTTIESNSTDQGLRVFPNPSQGTFNLSMQGDSLKNVEIFSVTGQPVFSQTYAQGKTNDQIDISNFSTGIYFIKAQGVDGKEYNAKVIKE